MIAMQYAISLPSDYDMEIIKNRVKNNGSKTDGFTDLKMKAYLVAERCKYTNYANQYAPFYLWEKEDGMNQFLFGGPFNNILNSFGRPIVHNWVVLHAHANKTTEQQFAVIKTVPIQATIDFSAFSANEKEQFLGKVNQPSTTTYITAYNPLTWELCHFYMSTDIDLITKEANGNLIFDVYHIS